MGMRKKMEGGDVREGDEVSGKCEEEGRTGR